MELPLFLRGFLQRRLPGRYPCFLVAISVSYFSYGQRVNPQRTSVFQLCEATAIPCSAFFSEGGCQVDPVLLYCPIGRFLCLLTEGKSTEDGGLSPVAFYLVRSTFSVHQRLVDITSVRYPSSADSSATSLQQL